MLAGMFRGATLVGLALALSLPLVLVSDATAGPHGRHHHGHGGGAGVGVGVSPTLAIAVGPGAAPGVGLGVGLGLGFGYVPFSVVGLGVGVGVAVPGSSADPRGALRLQVPQRETEVFIDGYYAGVVDDFDGSFQKLRLEPGTHTVTLYLDGYRAYEEGINSTYGSTIKIRHEMEPLEPGEPIPMRPSASAGAGSPAVALTAPYPGSSASAPPPPPVPPEPAASPGAGVATSARADYGVLSVRAQPSEVHFFVDGELWDLPPGSERLSIHLPIGSHQLRLAKEGYEDFELVVEVQPGETEALNVRLMPSP